MSRYLPILNYLYRSAVMVEGVLGVCTEGAQAIVMKDDSVLLIRTTYRPHWEFPGGKVERGEAPESGAIRETNEEAGVFVREIDRKLGTYTQLYLRRSVLIHVYVAKDWEERNIWQPTIEIADRAFFPLSELPTNISPATKRRIDELASGQEKEFSCAW